MIYLFKAYRYHEEQLNNHLPNFLKFLVKEEE